MNIHDWQQLKYCDSKPTTVPACFKIGKVVSNVTPFVCHSTQPELTLFPVNLLYIFVCVFQSRVQDWLLNSLIPILY